MNSLTMSFPRSREVASRPNLPSSTILSSKPPSAALAAACPAAAACSGLFIGGPLVLFLAQFLLQAVELLRIARSIHEQFIQPFVSLQSTTQVPQLFSQIKQFLQGFHLLGHLRWFEVVQTLEVQVDFELASIRIFAQLVIDAEGTARLKSLHDAVKIIRRALSTSPVFQCRQLLPCR